MARQLDRENAQGDRLWLSALIDADGRGLPPGPAVLLATSELSALPRTRTAPASGRFGLHPSSFLQPLNLITRPPLSRGRCAPRSRAAGFLAQRKRKT